MSVIFNLSYFFYLAGVILLISAFFTANNQENPHRFSSAFFWAAYGLIFILGDVIEPFWIGLLVLAMTVVAGLNRVRAGSAQMPRHEALEARAKQLKNRLFVPALMIPLLTIVFSFSLKGVVINGVSLLPAKSETLVSLGLACVIAFVVACFMTKETPVQSMRETRRLLEAMGWAVLLPQLLAVLGIIFKQAGVGDDIAYLTKAYMAIDYRLIAVIAYCVGMALFTMIMGNAFAAFPVITAGIGIPILIMQHGANPAIVCAIGMFSGYCGTLMTPMAANFNIVPAALLELKDKNAVIKSQLGTAIPLLITNIVLMYFLAFNF